MSRDRVLLRNVPVAAQDLSPILEVVARHQLRLASDTIDRMPGVTPEITWDDWKRLLALPRSSAGLRAMQQPGTIAAAIPEWRKIDGLVVRDFYHRYTVDEHTLVAIATRSKRSRTGASPISTRGNGRARPGPLRSADAGTISARAPDGEHVEASLRHRALGARTAGRPEGGPRHRSSF